MTTALPWYVRLKELRKGAGLRQEDVAAHLGIGRTTYLYIEAGARPPDADELVKLSTLYGVPANDLLEMVIEREPRPDVERSWLCVTAAEARLVQAARGDDLRSAVQCVLDMMTEAK